MRKFTKPMKEDKTVSIAPHRTAGFGHPAERHGNFHRASKNSHLGKIFYDKILKNKKCFGGAVNF